MTSLRLRVIIIKMRSAVFGIQHLEVCVNYALCYNAQGYPPLLAFAPKSQLSTMHYTCFWHH